jgi:hypothetical protein
VVKRKEGVVMHFVYRDEDGTIKINTVIDKNGQHGIGFAELHPGQTWMGHPFETLKDGRYDLDGKFVSELGVGGDL